MGGTIADIHWSEFIVLSITLILSMAVGVYYGFFGPKQNSTAEYLFANHQMSFVPVAISIAASTVSGITIITMPIENYLYGGIVFMWVLHLFLIAPALEYLFLPVYFNLEVNSAYEYLEIRFDRKVRIFVSTIALAKEIFGMPIAVYATNLAINQVSGIDIKLANVVLFSVCIFYSTFGGLKASIWAQVVQASILLISIGAVVSKGIYDADGFSNVRESASAMDRINFLNHDPDPRTRHTIWTGIIGGFFTNIPGFAATQGMVQKYMSLKSPTSIRRCLVTNFAAIAVIQLLCFMIGFVMVAKYSGCDPASHKIIKTSDQLVPYFVQDTTANSIHGILGLFIAALTSATLSAVSHGLHTVSALVTYEYVVGVFPNLPDDKLAWIAKVSCGVFGIMSYFVTFGLEYLGNILEIIITLMSITLGPTFALFTLGMFFPWANSKGSLLGMITGVTWMVTYTVFQTIAVDRHLLPDQRLCLNTFGCNMTMTVSDIECHVPSNWKSVHENDPFQTKLLSVSIFWFGMMGILVTIFSGIVFSIIFTMTQYEGRTRQKSSPVSRKCFSPPVLRFWEWLLPTSYLCHWVEKEGV